MLTALDNILLKKVREIKLFDCHSVGSSFNQQIYFNLSMQEFKATSLENLDKPPAYQQYSSLKIDVVKPFEHKEIDTRWIELKLGGKFISRSYFASCIQAGKVYIHGGYNQQKGIIDDFIQAQFYDLPSKWNEIKVRSTKSKNPPGLRNHTLCAYTSNLILFGGQKNMLENNNNLYRFDLRTGQWQTVKVFFQGNKDFHLSLDSHIAQIHNDSMYIFGGYESETGTYSNTIYEVKLKNINNNEVSIGQIQVGDQKPVPRGNLSSCIVDNKLYIFGGTNSDLVFDDFWFFDFQKLTWTEIKKPSKGNKKQWPQKRKGHVMVSHGISRTIFMFGGIRQITKQQNDIMVFSVPREKWVRIHKNTNELYDPSPTFKKLQQTSPSVINAKNRKSEKKDGNKNQFRLGLRRVTFYNSKSSPQNPEPNSGYYKPYMTGSGSAGFAIQKNELAVKKGLSVVQEKKIRDFMMRKKKLLDEVTQVQQVENNKKRSHSPTSESLIYSIDSIGEQQKSPGNYHNELPKVIFDEQKGAVTGKKPCARDGHAGLPYEDSMIIIGGDRHMISFSDVYLFKMDKAINSLHVYQ